MANVINQSLDRVARRCLYLLGLEGQFDNFSQLDLLGFKRLMDQAWSSYLALRKEDFSEDVSSPGELITRAQATLISDDDLAWINSENTLQLMYLGLMIRLQKYGGNEGVALPDINAPLKHFVGLESVGDRDYIIRNLDSHGLGKASVIDGGNGMPMIQSYLQSALAGAREQLQNQRMLNETMRRDWEEIFPLAEQMEKFFKKYSDGVYQWAYEYAEKSGQFNTAISRPANDEQRYHAIMLGVMSGEPRSIEAKKFFFHSLRNAWYQRRSKEENRGSKAYSFRLLGDSNDKLEELKRYYGISRSAVMDKLINEAYTRVR